MILGVALLLLCLIGVGLVLARSVVGGSNNAWQTVGLQGQTVHFLAPGHSRPGLLFAAADIGVERRETAQADWKLVLPVPTAWSVALLPDDRTVLAGDQEGYVDISRDGGAHWHRRLLSAGGVFAVTSQPGNARLVLAGAAGGVFRSDDGGVRWHRVLHLPRSAAAAFSWLPGEPNTLLAGAVAGDVGGKTQVYVSHDAGLHWRVLGHGLRSKAGIMALAASSAGTVFTGTMGNRIWSIPAGGSTWHLTATGIPEGQHVSGIAVVPGHRTDIYAATLAAGVFVSRDSGRRWQSVSSGLPSTDGDQIVLSVIYASRERAVYAGTTDGVYEHFLITQG